MTRKRRDPAPPDDDDSERKERVLHTRVPERLETQLRERAQDLGISVSNLVRNVLGHAFGLVGDVVADSHAIARAARGETTRPAGAAPAASSVADVLAWQPVKLGRNAVCAECNAILARGSEAALGAGTTLVLCTDCLEAIA